MKNYQSFLSKLKICLYDYRIDQVLGEQWAFIVNQFLSEDIPNKHIFICVDENEAQAISWALGEKQTILIPELDTRFYSSLISSESLFNSYFSSLISIYEGNFKYIVTTLNSLLMFAPTQKVLLELMCTLKVDDIISQSELFKLLINIGYQNDDNLDTPGTFTKRGEVVDIYTINNKCVRLLYFDDLIESIKFFDYETKRTTSLITDSINIYPSPYFIFKPEYIRNFRENFPRFSLQHKTKLSKKDSIFSAINKQNRFDDFNTLYALFFQNFTSLWDLLKSQNHLIHFLNKDRSIKNIEAMLDNLKNNYNEVLEDENSSIVIPEVDKLISHEALRSIATHSAIIINSSFTQHYGDDNNFNVEKNLAINFTDYLKKNHASIQLSADQFQFIKKLFEIIDKLLSNGSKITFVTYSSKAVEEIKFLASENINSSYANNLDYIVAPLKKGFYNEIENHFYITDSDIFAEKIKKISNQSRSKNLDHDIFADQLLTLMPGDFVIHKEHGLAKYEGLETLSVNNVNTDFLKLCFDGNDKVYVPIYKMNMIQKHADNTGSFSLASLKSNKFEQAKAKSKSAIKKLAFDLLELNAKRKLSQSYAFSPPDHHFKEFELAFTFDETPDQLMAINDVIEDMCSNRPMDRLVCGDVGFGKTEVAMRAAFKAVLDGKQVAILVPTTILAFQHYETFKKRFKNFAVSIDYISRFRTTKETQNILTSLENGKIDIIIGTHKLLSESIKYHDLGLLIIDEEHRFGVGHKEKLKNIKLNLDCLTMTATPIPRTLQLSFVGIRDLSLISTAPPSRQSIRSYVIQEDANTIKNAIEFELKRGGQIFIVHNRVNDIEIITHKIQKLVPSAKIVYAHGQLPENELEKRIKDFYEHKFDILIATTIIESGIDIPSANTLIVNRADMFGLAQLHQIRGRIGRSDRKAYAYFVVPETRILSGDAEKRLTAIQRYADIGSGFSLASSDLEIRGSGDILGAEQSGHIQTIGLELYMELLNDAVKEINGNTITPVKNDIEFQVNFESFIPDSYISNPGHRLKYYKKLSNSHDLLKIKSIEDELSDIYGEMPRPLKNLTSLLKTRIFLSPLAIKKLSASSHYVTLYFDKNILDTKQALGQKIVQFFSQRPKVYKINPDYSVKCTFKSTIDQDTLLEFSKHIAAELEPC